MSACILIVEIEGPIALDLTRKLEHAGYEVSAVANSAETALCEVERRQPSFVLLDIKSNGSEDGIDAADLIRRRFGVPVIFVTADADYDILNRGGITEPFGYIVKPFVGVNFRAQIEMALWTRAMEEKLRASEAWLSATLRNVGDAIVTADGAGMIATMNPAAERLSGWTIEAAAGCPLGEVLRLADDTGSSPLFTGANPAGENLGRNPAPVAYRMLPLGGESFIPVECTFSVNRTDERVLGLIVVLRDLTERRQAEERGRQIQKMRAISLLSTGVGRELRQTLRVIDTDLEELLSEAGGTRKRLLQDVFAASSRARALAEQLTMMGRTEVAHPEFLDVNKLISELTPRLTKYFGRKRTLVARLEPGVPLIRADREDLRQSIANLVIEAREAIPGGGTVEIETGVTTPAGEASEVFVRVRDSGRAIPMQAGSNVFSAYSQSRPGKRNAGLLLALVYHFVTLNDGAIDVESSPETGTAFVLRFPASGQSPLSEWNGEVSSRSLSVTS